MLVDAVEEVWLDRDNVTEFVVVSDGDPVTNLANYTRVVFCINNELIDSDVVGSEVIWWTDLVTDKELPDGSTYTGNVVRARLGQAGLTAGEYEDSRLVMYAAESPNGVVISDNITFIVYEACEA